MQDTMYGLASANKKRIELKKKKVDFIKANYFSMDKKVLRQKLVDEFGCAFSSAGKLIWDYESNYGIVTAKPKKETVKETKPKKITKIQQRLDFIKDNYNNMSKTQLVELLVEKFNCRKSSAYTAINTYEKGLRAEAEKAADKLIKERIIQPKTTPKLKIDDSDYFTNNWNWKPRAIKRA